MENEEILENIIEQTNRLIEKGAENLYPDAFQLAKNELGNFSYGLIGELDRETAYWLADKILRKTGFQIGPLDMYYYDDTNTIGFFDGKEAVYTTLKKADIYKLKKFSKVYTK